MRQCEIYLHRIKCGLLTEEDDKPVYITRRFDVHSGGKYKQEDFAALLGWSKDITAEMLTNFGTNEHPHKAADPLITY